jgi:hypothetical protein
VGIVGALFFRNEPIPTPALPELQSAEAIDAQIADQPHAPYLTGLESADDAGPKKSNAISGRPPRGDVPEFLKQDRAGTDPFATAGTPDPIPAVGTSASSPIPIPPHNQAWTPEPGTKTAATAQEPVQPSGERRHVVQAGDTLSDLAGRYLGSSLRFRELYEANRDQLRSPDDLRVGLTLRIPGPATAREARNVPDGSQPASATSPGPFQPISTPTATGAAPTESRTEQRVRFQPVSRSPFSPRPTAPADKPNPKPTRSLSQLPPIGIPGVTQETQIEPRPAEPKR